MKFIKKLFRCSWYSKFVLVCALDQVTYSQAWLSLQSFSFTLMLSVIGIIGNGLLIFIIRVYFFAFEYFFIDTFCNGWFAGEGEVHLETDNDIVAFCCPTAPGWRARSIPNSFYFWRPTKDIYHWEIPLSKLIFKIGNVVFIFKIWVLRMLAIYYADIARLGIVFEVKFCNHSRRVCTSPTLISQMVLHCIFTYWEGLFREPNRNGIAIRPIVAFRSTRSIETWL